MPLAPLLAGLFTADDLASASALLAAPAPPLFPVEAAAVVKAVPRRRIEFAYGRACARRALAALGVAPAPLAVRDDRSPDWPDGFVGSISHSRTVCAAVVGRAPAVRSLGLDVEERALMPPEDWPSICREPELARLSEARNWELGELVTLSFAAKEAVYKAQAPLTGDADLEFLDVEVEFDLAGGTFAATFRDDGLAGRFAVDSAYLVAGVTIR